MLDFIRIACAVPGVKVADVQKNAGDICRYIVQADDAGADVVVFPELALTGYTCGDLLHQDTLWQGVKKGLRMVADCSGKHPNITVVIGMPVRLDTKYYNCAAVIAGGEVGGIVPKTSLTIPEKRWFSAGSELKETWLKPEKVGLAPDGCPVPVCADQLFRIGDGTVVGIEICEDGMVPQPRSAELAVKGAEVILNLAASHEIAGKSAYRRQLVRHQSGACKCVYAFVSSGCTESTSDMVYSGHSLVGENGEILCEDGPLKTDYLLVTDCDLGSVRAERIKSQHFGQAPENWLITELCGDKLRADGSMYPVSRTPFLPAGEDDCLEIFRLQAAGLKQRLAAIGAKAVVGVSGGMDSTLALLVAVEAMRQLGRPAEDVHGITMPCFGTTDRTYQNALSLMKTLGITTMEIPVGEAVMGHFRDIGHDAQNHDTTYENAQARERTQVLMDYAGTVGGIVVGTGDLSELALGWCTYNADHMSMYNVNASVPKTLISRIIRAASGMKAFASSRTVLEDILDTPISPELLPPNEAGMISQQTEEIVGPYLLHDFFLYYMIRYGFDPKKIFTLACRAFTGEYDSDTIKKWLKFFYRRFFSQQFKRNCLPDGIKVGAVSLSPRGDWSMPSDACGKLWLDMIDTL